MNIHQALKEKNRLAGKLKQLDERIKSNSRWIKGNKPSYDAEELLEDRTRIVLELNSLKKRLSLATQPILHTILALAEKKSYIMLLRVLELGAGTTYDRYASTAAIDYEAAMSEMKRDELVEATEKEINELQDELDQFNAITELKN